MYVIVLPDAIGRAGATSSGVRFGTGSTAASIACFRMLYGKERAYSTTRPVRFLVYFVMVCRDNV